MKIAKALINAKTHLAPIIIFFLFISGNAIAQPQPNNPDRGAKVGSAYAISDFETINTNNGNLMLNFPLGSLPKGRGEVGGGISLMYSSKLYDTHTERIQDMTVPCGGGPCTYFQKVIINESDKGGWKYVLGSYSLEVKDRRDRYNDPVSGSNPPICWIDGQGQTAVWNEMTYVYKVNMIFPDGSSHEMIPRDQTPSADGQRFYRINPDGKEESCGASPIQKNRPTYYSIDGSYLRLQKHSETEWTLYFPDGKKIVTTASSQRTYDRNGNYVDGPNDQWGRTVSITQSNEYEDIVRSMGANGEKLEWRVIWKNIFVKKTYQACTPIQGNNCPQEHQREDLGVLMRVVDQIIQPQQLGGQAYTFTYNAPDYSDPPQTSEGWGEISRVTLPSGAYIDYEYAMDGEDGPDDDWNIDEILKNYPISKTLHYALEYDGNTTSASETWTYSTSASQGTIVSPDGSYVTNYFGSSPNGWDSGLTYKTVSSAGTMTEKLWERNFPEVCYSSACNPLAPTNTYVKTEFNSIKDSSGNYSLTAIKDYSYDKNGNVTLVKEYDWVAYSTVPRDQYGNVTGIPSGITPKRISATGYYAETPDAGTLSTDSDLYILPGSPALKGTVKWSEIRNGSNQAVSRTEITYDDAATTGNPIEAKAWDNTKGIYSTSLDSSPSGNAISTKTQYNSYGMPTVATDANGVQTTITYENIDTPNGPVSDLYPTKVETASNYSTLKRTSTFTYDFLTGLTLTSTDLDNGITNAIEYDDAGRPKKSITGQGTALESWVQTEYDDLNRRIIVRADLETIGDGKKVAIQHFDPLGRMRLSRALENAAIEDATDEHEGIKVQTRYSAAGTCSFDSGQVCSFQLTSNPYRAATSAAAASEPTMGWTRSQGAALGKHSEIETFAGGSLPAPWGGNSSTTGKVKTDIDGNRTLVTDQAEKKRISKTNALGQLTDIWEVTGQDSDTEPISFPGAINVAFGYKTSYNYGVLGNLAIVAQGSQTRSFTYSSLSRLLSSANPESGTISYNYDQNGNLVQKADARNVVVSYTYDALNRITQRSYAGETGGYSTPMVTYEYDNQPHAKGKLTKISSSISENQFTSFDVLGRVLSSVQVTDGRNYIQNYLYNLSGILIEQEYPSLRKVKNVLNNDGSLSLVESKKNATSGYWAYANSFSYTPAGTVSSMQLGNGNWESANFNSRLQPTSIALGDTHNSTNLLKLDYSYGTNQNNDNVQSQTITVQSSGTGPEFVAAQNYQYDSLNRLSQATETVSNQPGWQQTFVYDRYGNRRFDTSNDRTTTLEANCLTAVCNPEVNPSNNRLVGTTFDSAGNTSVDASSQQYTYDGENKMVAAKDESGNLVGQYWYDGDGKRVKKYVPATEELTIFVYDVTGKTIEEYSTVLSKDQQVSYLTSDHLGSPRLNTNASGGVTARHDYHPFGEEITGDGRSTDIDYGADEIRKKFTGYERDAETDLEFAQARMYASYIGRFTTTDPLLASGRLNLPSSWNRYAYVLNNPLRMVDPTGLQDCEANKPCKDKPPPPKIVMVVQSKDKNGNPIERAPTKAEQKAVDTLIQKNWPITYDTALNEAVRSNNPSSEVTESTETRSTTDKVEIGVSKQPGLTGSSERGQENSTTSGSVPGLETALNSDKNYRNNNAVFVSQIESTKQIGNAPEAAAMINKRLRDEATRLVEAAFVSGRLPDATYRRQEAQKQLNRPPRVGPFPTNNRRRP